MKSRKTPRDWRRAVLLEPAITDSTRVLMLVLAEHMRENLTVSVPRRDLSRWLNRSERRIQERIKNAQEAGLLDTVVRGQKGVTAVYAGLFPEAFSRTVSSTLNDTGNRHPEPPFSRTHGGPTSSKRPPELSPRGRVSNDERQRRGARPESGAQVQADVDRFHKQQRQEKSA